MNCLEACPREPFFLPRREGRRGLCASRVPLRWEAAPPSQRAQAGLPTPIPGFLSLKNDMEIWARSLPCLPGAAPPPGPGCGGGGALIPGRGSAAGSGTAPPPRAGERGGGSGRDGGRRGQVQVQPRSSTPLLQQRSALRGPYRQILRKPPSLRGVDVWEC